MNNLIIFGAKYLIYMLLLGAAFYFFTLEKKRRKELLIFAAIVLPSAYVLAKISALLYWDPRPFVVGGFVPLIPHAPDNGFPSDHTLLVSAVALVVFAFNKKVGSAFLLLALVVGFSRVLAGVHHAVDVFGSLVFAAIAFYATKRWALPSLLKKQKN